MYLLYSSMFSPCPAIILPTGFSSLDRATSLGRRRTILNSNISRKHIISLWSRVRPSTFHVLKSLGNAWILKWSEKEK